MEYRFFPFTILHKTMCITQLCSHHPEATLRHPASISAPPSVDYSSHSNISENPFVKRQLVEGIQRWMDPEDQLPKNSIWAVLILRSLFKASSVGESWWCLELHLFCHYDKFVDEQKITVYSFTHLLALVAV